MTTIVSSIKLIYSCILVLLKIVLIEYTVERIEVDIV